VGLHALRRKYAYLFSQIAGDFSVEQPNLTKPVNAQAVSDFLLQYDNILFFFVSELIDLLLTDEDQSDQSAEQSGRRSPHVNLQNLNSGKGCCVWPYAHFLPCKWMKV